MEAASVTVSFEDFQKLDLRVGRIVTAEPVPKANKLLKLTVDVGQEQRTVVAGIAASYRPEALVGKNIILVANLAPQDPARCGVAGHGPSRRDRMARSCWPASTLQ